ncbi:fatty acid desaturase family protein [Acidisoma cladoniae]|jgi:fatty acid desaturase|uniref:fatty acid desaturase family protein n=1 Tax=Acidisoma cladoniae TaxID=3040935 RepID=UPI00254F9F86|nr:fatty acid desaturase family protein [Acidisoma sp. PAMC 29798]
MAEALRMRDYSLTGEDARLAQEKGLSAASWYATPLARKQLKELMKRKDGPAIRDTAIWFAALALTAIGGIWFWGTWAAVPFFIAYGTLYGSSADSRWHECGHGTAFKTRWTNDVLYYIASFMLLREPTVWRWSHARHHTDTIIVGRDPEIAVPRPAQIANILLNLFSLKGGIGSLKQIAFHATGRLGPAEASYIPATEQFRVFRAARVYLAILVATVLASVALHSFLPLMLVGLPTFYGSWLMVIFGITQHAGLDEDVLDHRLNSRTIYMNGLCRFLYWNMNYHVEHHMFPMVPYHALPQLHEAVKDDCPVPYRSLREAYREIIPALIRQSRDPRYFVRRPLPAKAYQQPIPVAAE